MTDTPDKPALPISPKIAGLTPGAASKNPLAAIVELSTKWPEKAILSGLRLYQPSLDIMTRQMVEKWVEEDKRNHTTPDGTSAAGRYYSYLKDTFGSPSGTVMTWMSMIPEWQRNMMFKSQAFQNVMRSEFMVRQFRLIDSIIRESYPDDHGTLYKPEYNHQFLSENSENKIVTVDEDSIVALFKKPEKNTSKSHIPYPRLLITSSHAQGESLADVTSITHGFEALARDSHDGKPLNHGYVDKGVKPGQTLTLYACDVEQSPWLNGAELLERVLELKEIARTGKPDRFEHVSPGAKRIAKLMLKCMVEQPERIDTKDPRHLSDIVGADDAPLVLRDDAVEIANHFQLIGYSKGGNVVSDAMRYLVTEIASKNERGATLFQTHSDSPGHAAHGKHMNQNSIHDIVRGISVMALASIEVGMAQRYKDCGVRRVAFNNKHDSVSEHSNYHGTMFDERYLIEGTPERAGHAPDDMMGTRGSDVQAAVVGYAHDDEKVTRRLMEFFAPNYADAAIGHVHFDHKTAKEGVFAIEAASGTTDKQMSHYIDKIKAALVKRNLFGVTIEHHPQKPALFMVTCAPQDSAIDFSTDRVALNNLRLAFHDLRQDKENPVVTMRIENEINAFARAQGMKDLAVSAQATGGAGYARGGDAKQSRTPWGLNRTGHKPGSALDKLTG